MALELNGTTGVIDTGLLHEKIEKVISTDNAIVRFDGTTGKVQNSGVFIDDNGNIGIGTNKPVTKLSVNNSANGTEAIRIGNSVGGNGSVQGSTYIGLTHFGISDTSFSSALIGVIEDGTSSYNASLIFSTRGSGTDTLATERMRIDSAGIVGIGITPSAWISSYKVIEIGSKGNAFFSTVGQCDILQNAYYDTSWKYGTTGYYATRYTNSGTTGQHQWLVAPSGTAGNAITWNQVMSLDNNGILTLSPNNTSGIQDGLVLYDTGSGVAEGIKIKWSSLNYSNIAAIYGSSSYGLFFQVGGIDKMTLDTSGNLLVGVASDTATPNNGVTIRNTVGTVGNIGVGHASGTVTGNAYQTFAYAGTQIGSIYQSGTTAVVYATTSDYRLKENIRPADCKKFMDIKFVDYERIDGRHECGVIAHELQEIYPDLVTGEKDATEIRKVEISPAIEEVKDEDGNIITEAVEAVYEEQEFPVYQQVNYMGLIARIGTVVQQQAKLIEELTKRLEILESK